MLLKGRSTSRHHYVAKICVDVQGTLFLADANNPFLGILIIISGSTMNSLAVAAALSATASAFVAPNVLRTSVSHNNGVSFSLPRHIRDCSCWDLSFGCAHRVQSIISDNFRR